MDLIDLVVHVGKHSPEEGHRLVGTCATRKRISSRGRGEWGIPTEPETDLSGVEGAPSTWTWGLDFLCSAFPGQSHSVPPSVK